MSRFGDTITKCSQKWCHESIKHGIMKFLSGILKWCYWMRFAQTESDLALWLRDRRSNSLMMALMAHQISLILLFLLLQTFKLVDPSCSLDRYTVWTFSDQVWSRSISRNRRKLLYIVISENAAWNTSWIGSHMAKMSWSNCLLHLWPCLCQFVAISIEY